MKRNFYGTQGLPPLFVPDSRKILMVVHQETSDPGLVGQLLHRQGYDLDVRCLATGDQLPETMDDHEAAVIFGGPMSANDDETLPFIRTELDWIAIALASGKPYLGICLGAQMLARVLGATVTSHPQELREIGYVPIQPTTAGKDYFPRPLSVYHWHREGFEMPQGGVLLATGEVFPNQAFRYGQNAYGLQFHPEMTADIMQHWLTNGAEQLELPGAQPREEHLRQHTQHAQAMEQWLTAFLHHWLGTAIAHR